MHDNKPADARRIIFDRLATDSSTATGAQEHEIELPFAQRQKARQPLQLRSGLAAGLMLPRGTVLRDGDQVQSACGQRLRVSAAPEQVSTVYSQDAQLLARVAYHLGNRHLWVQIGDGWLRYLHDHVLDDMVRGLQLEPSVEQVPFEPEAGAYSEHGASHAH